MGIDPTDPDEMMATATKIIAELTETMRDRTSALGDNAARRLAQRYAARTRPVAVRPLASLEAAEHAATAVVRWRHGLVATIERCGGRVLLRLPDRTISFPEPCGDAVAALHRGLIADAGSLSGLDAADGEVVIRRLLREAVVIPADREYSGPAGG
jgi:bifunctional lysine-specific demethylase and histidyl-hydroxylase NO66